jgi:hypothetical protein
LHSSLAAPCLPELPRYLSLWYAVYYAMFFLRNLVHEDDLLRPVEDQTSLSLCLSLSPLYARLDALDLSITHYGSEMREGDRDTFDKASSEQDRTVHWLAHACQSSPATCLYGMLFIMLCFLLGNLVHEDDILRPVEDQTSLSLCLSLFLARTHRHTRFICLFHALQPFSYGLRHYQALFFSYSYRISIHNFGFWI